MTAVVSSCSTWQRCNWHSHFHAATIGLPEVWWAALKRSTSSDFLAFELKAIPLSFNDSFKTATVIFFAGPYFIRSYFSYFSLFAASLSFFSWLPSRSRCPSISASVSVRRRTLSADGVTGIFWMNQWESRIMYFFERKASLLALYHFRRLSCNKIWKSRLCYVQRLFLFYLIPSWE